MRRNTRNRKQKQRKPKGRSQVMPLPSARLNASPWSSPVMPRQIDIMFEEIWLGTITSASTQIVKRFNPNSLYAPEVGGAPASIPGFAYWGNLYNAYRVIAYQYEVEFSNLEAFAVETYIINNSVGFATTSTVRTSISPFSQSHLLSAKGGQDRKRMTKFISLAALQGSASEVNTDDTYAAGFGASPQDLFWLGLGAQSSTASVLSNGVACTLKLKMFARLYEPKTLV